MSHLSDTETDPAEPTRPHYSLTRDARERRTREITCALATCVDEARRQALRDELVEINMPVADSVTARYRNRGIDEDDLRQVAYLALTKAAQRFDATSGHAFLAFCVPTIRGELRRHFRDHGWVVRPPRRIQELQQRISSARAQLSATVGGTPSDHDLAAALGEELADVREALDCAGCFAPTSLDARVGDSTVGDLFGDEERGLAAVEARVVLAPLVRSLSERDRQILRLRFVNGLTQREIAADIGVTQMQVSRLLKRIYRDVRVGLASNAAEPRPDCLDDAG
jgi:RNA polymerase sigma-B factor